MSTKLLNSGNSVRDEHRNRRIASVGLSPAFPTIKKLTIKQKTKLWQQLRKLDREVDRLKYAVKVNRFLYISKAKQLEADKVKLGKVDLKRKEVRNTLKGY